MRAIKSLLAASFSIVLAMNTVGCIDEKDEQSSVSLAVVVNSTGSSDSRGRAVNRSDTGLVTVGQKVSFTPDSLFVSMESIILFSEWVENSNGERIGGGKEISIPINEEVNLISPTAFNDLYAQKFPITVDHFGEYIGAKLLLKDTITVSGSVTINRATYRLHNLRLPIGFSGSHFSLTTPLLITDTVSNPTVRLVFETEESVILRIVDSISGDSTLPVLSDGKTRAGAANMVMIPYVGSSIPTVEKYQILIDRDSSYFLKMILVADPEGDVVTAAIAPVFTDQFGIDGYTVGAVDVAAWQSPVISKDGGSYTIAPNPLFPDLGASDRMATFPAFSQNNHSGTVQIGYPSGINRSYEATIYATTK